MSEHQREQGVREDECVEISMGVQARNLVQALLRPGTVYRHVGEIRTHASLVDGIEGELVTGHSSSATSLCLGLQ